MAVACCSNPWISRQTTLSCNHVIMTMYFPHILWVLQAHSPQKVWPASTLCLIPPVNYPFSGTCLGIYWWPDKHNFLIGADKQILWLLAVVKFCPPMYINSVHSELAIWCAFICCSRGGKRDGRLNWQCFLTCLTEKHRSSDIVCFHRHDCELCCLTWLRVWFRGMTFLHQPE